MVKVEKERQKRNKACKYFSKNFFSIVIAALCLPTQGPHGQGERILVLQRAGRCGQGKGMGLKLAKCKDFIMDDPYSPKNVSCGTIKRVRYDRKCLII